MSARTLLKSFIKIIGGAVFALGSQGVLAQGSGGPIEEVVVTGVRSSLEDALDIKRNSSSIVDGISATDIDALPALDLGEAMQAIPGVQLNNDQEGRLSSISLRGLGGGFVKTTATGQSFASPSPASNLNAVGSPNPFAAFEAGIFDGVTIVKSPTADMQAGGVAGTVDMRLQQALSKRHGVYVVSVGGRYEELTGETDPNMKLSGVHHIIDDKLGVAFKLAGSGQTFRRDTFDVINWTSVDTDNGDVRATNIDAYRAAWGLPDDAQLRAPGRGRNVSEFSDGDRISFAGNIEYNVTDDLSIGAHILLSERNLDSGTKEAATISPGFNTNRRDRDNFDGRVTLDMNTAPFSFDRVSDDPGAPLVYGVSRYDFTDGSLQFENRKTTFVEKSEGIILYADFAKDDWLFDGKFTHSDATNEFENVGIGFNHNQDWRAQSNFTDANGRRNNLPSVPTGFDGTIDVGGGLGNTVVEGAFAQPYVYNNLVWQIPNLSSSSVTSVSDANQGRRIQHYVNGRVRDLTRDLTSAEASAERALEFGFADAFRFDTVKFGYRYSRETLDSLDQRQGFAGIDTSNISDAYITNQPLSAVQTSYFNGHIPGTFDNTSGWMTIDNELAIATLQQNIAQNVEDIPTGTSFGTQYPGLMRNRSGFWDTQNRNTSLPTNLAFNFDAEQAVTAIYAMTDFSGEWGSVGITGNLGVRYIETRNTFHGFETQVDAQGRNGVAVPAGFTDDYSHTLPIVNVAFSLTEDIILRAAYSEGLVRPNLLAQRPTAGIRGGDQSVRLDLPTATVRPYDATNYDLSLEWYNRRGSAMSIGFFKKDISNLFATETGFCPLPGENAIVDDLLGPLDRQPSQDGSGFICTQATPTIDVNGNQVFRDVTINAPVNTAEEIAVDGFEIAIQQNLDFLPYPWNGFGGVVNYTKIEQDGDEAQLSRVSPESYNIIGYWEDDKFSLRLAYNWRDDQIIVGANSFLGTNARIREATERLDFVGSYKFNEKLTMFLRGYNLTDDIGLEYLGFDERAVSRQTYTGRIWQLAMNYRF